MNREILFKAKRKDNGKWIEGAVLPACNGTYIATSFLEGDFDEPLIVAAYEVVPETVCQYTGLTDKNGKKIWENDIVRFEKYNAVVRFEKGTYVMKWINEMYFRDDFYFWATDRRSFIENIGNIFDNPELLEVEQ